jgi:hypothetical protein
MPEFAASRVAHTDVVHHTTSARPAQRRCGPRGFMQGPTKMRRSDSLPSPRDGRPTLVYLLVVLPSNVIHAAALRLLVIANSLPERFRRRNALHPESNDLLDLHA